MVLQHAICRNCHRPGHTREDCPHEGQCQRCYSLRHSIDQCPYNSPQFSRVTFISVPHNAPRNPAVPCPEDLPTDHIPQERSEAATHGITIDPLGRRSLVPTSATDDLEHNPSLSLTHHVVFPDLFKLIESVVKSLWDEEWSHCTVLSYYGMIEMYGGQEAVVQAMWRSIPPEIKELQGKVVTIEELDRIRAIQDRFENWPRESGYLDYITDDRSLVYWRPYVGQGSDAGIRIHQHLTAAEKDKRNTLHYYIVSEGGRFRAMNYIRLWSLPSEVATDQNAKQARLLLNNALEAVMCFAFQSLRPSDLEFYLGEGSYASTGLNVLPPFLQGISLDISTRTAYVNKCLDSEDEEIRRWPIERKRQRDVSRSVSNTRGKYPKYWRQPQYWEAFEHAIRTTENCKNFVWPPYFQGPCATSLNDLPQPVKDVSDPPLSRPFGSFAALVGVILDPCPVSSNENRENIEENITAIPSALIQANFTPLNSLIWTHDLRQCYQSGSNSNRSASSSQDEALRVFHRSLIEASSLKVILLAGRMAEARALPAEAAEHQTTLYLRGCSFKAFLEVDKQKCEIKRIYIRLVSSLAVTSRCDSWEEAKEHAEAFRFAATITKSANIHGFTIASRLVGKEIILRYWSEKQRLLEPITINSISPSLHEWFSLRGITTNEGIRQFEHLGGSLAAGAFLLLCILPRRKWGQIRQRYLKQDISKSAGKSVFGKETIQQARELLTQLTGTDPTASYREDSTMLNVPVTCVSSSKRDKDVIPQEGPSNSRQDKAAMPREEPFHLEQIEDAISSEDIEKLFQDCKNCDLYSEELSLSNSDFQPHAPEPSYKLAKLEDEERNTLLRGKFFKGHAYHKPANHYQIWALKNMLTVRFSCEDVDERKGFILKVEMSPPGTRHPHVYAKQASHDDPAGRIAVKITAKLRNGEDFSLYAQQPDDGWKEPMRLNTVFDWFSGATLEQIAAKNQPRRYIYISQKDYEKYSARQLSTFVQGGFTDDSLSERQLVLWETEQIRRAGLQRGQSSRQSVVIDDRTSQDVGEESIEQDNPDRGSPEEAASEGGDIAERGDENMQGTRE